MAIRQTTLISTRRPVVEVEAVPLIATANLLVLLIVITVVCLITGVCGLILFKYVSFIALYRYGHFP